MGADPVDLADIVPRTQAVGHRMFPGKLDRRHLPPLQQVAILIVRGLEGDFRDWAAVRRWADAIADDLGARASTS